MESVLVGISYNGRHNKGDEEHSSEAVRVPPAEHARWLGDSVVLYRAELRPFMRSYATKVVVVGCGMKDLLYMDAPGEREAMWAVLRYVPVLSHPEPEGHQVGAATCLRLGLEAAGYWGYEYYLHTAEDILPRPGAVEAMLGALDRGNDYAGYSWSDCLNCSFFACRTKALAGTFDREKVREYRGLEHYLTALLEGRPKEIFEGGGRGKYLTTHDYAQYRRWLRSPPESDAPPCVRTMADYERHKDYLETEPGRE